MTVETGHLVYCDGRVYLRRADDDDIEIYRFRGGPGWPPGLGAEPGWLATEHDEIADVIEDSEAFARGCGWTEAASYATAKGR